MVPLRRSPGQKPLATTTLQVADSRLPSAGSKTMARDHTLRSITFVCPSKERLRNAGAFAVLKTMRHRTWWLLDGEIGRPHAASPIAFRSSRLLAAAPISEDPETDCVGKLSRRPALLKKTWCKIGNSGALGYGAPLGPLPVVRGNVEAVRGPCSVGLN